MRTAVSIGLSLSLTLIGIIASVSVASDRGQSPAGRLRNILLNGVDISSARGQHLKNVDVTINEQGDVLIVAPHYQVHEEDSYIPLSKYVQNLNTPEHKAPQAAGSGMAKSLPTRPVQPPMAVKVTPEGPGGSTEGTQAKGSNRVASDTPGQADAGDASNIKPASSGKADADKAEDSPGSKAGKTSGGEEKDEGSE